MYKISLEERAVKGSSWFGAFWTHSNQTVYLSLVTIVSRSNILNVTQESVIVSKCRFKRLFFKKHLTAGRQSEHSKCLCHVETLQSRKKNVHGCLEVCCGQIWIGIEALLIYH